LVAISPTTREFAKVVHDQHSLPFDVLSDLRNEVAARFGLVFRLPDYLIKIYKSFPLNLPDYNADESWTLPVPARFIVSTDGIIRKVDADPDYTRRPEPDATVAFLRELC
jgi:peroxiredoxin